MVAGQPDAFADHWELLAPSLEAKYGLVADMQRDRLEEQRCKMRDELLALLGPYVIDKRQLLMKESTKSGNRMVAPSWWLDTLARSDDLEILRALPNVPDFSVKGRAPAGAGLPHDPSTLQSENWTIDDLEAIFSDLEGGSYLRTNGRSFGIFPAAKPARGRLMQANGDLRSRFEEIALQRYLMRPRVYDRALIASGWTVRFAVDTNVLGTFLTPEVVAEAGTSQGGVIGVGEIFRSDPAERKQAIAAALANHIWFDLQREAPLLMLPPLHVEFKAMIDHFANQSASNIERTQKDQFESIIDDYNKSTNSLNIEYLNRIRHVVMEDTRHTARMRRLKAIFERDRLRNAHSTLDEHHFDEDFRIALKSEVNDLDRSIYLAQLKSAWAERLSVIGRDSNAGLRRDAEAVARVELANRFLESRRKRLIYITNDTSIIEAGEKYLLQNNAEEWLSFSSCFIRHTRSFLDEPNVLNPHAHSAQSGTSLTHWMDLLLGRFDDVNGLASPAKGKVHLSEKMVATLSRIPNADEFIREIDDRWMTYEAASMSDAPDSALSILAKKTLGKTEKYSIYRRI